MNDLKGAASGLRLLGFKLQLCLLLVCSPRANLFSVPCLICEMGIKIVQISTDWR